jgi:amino acid permease
MRGSIFSVMQAALGAGILSLPYVFKQSGIAVGTVFLIIGALIAY